MRFIGVRALENQAALMHHKAREMLEHFNFWWNRVGIPMELCW
jgi:hypothetical protein